MRIIRCRSGTAGSAAFLTLLVMAMGCGGGASIEEEMASVPGLCFVHLHMVRGFDTSLLREYVDGAVPLWLCDSLLERGPLGVSLLGINLTDLSPQLQFLSRDITPSELAALASSGLGCESRVSGERLDLTTSTGSVLASAAGRDGWTCLVTGSGADGAIGRWLELEAGSSLAADSALVSVAGGDCDLTVLVSSNSIAFLSFIPDGMLSRSERRILDSIRAVIQQVGPEALRAGIGIDSTDPLSIFLEIEMLRSDGGITLMRVDGSDSGISLDSLVSIVVGLAGG